MEKLYFCTYVKDIEELELIKRRIKFSGLEVDEVQRVPMWKRIRGIFRKKKDLEMGLDFIPQYVVLIQCTVDEWKKYMSQWGLVNLGTEER